MDSKVFEDIKTNFKNAFFSDIKILSGLMDSEELNEYIQECLSKLYK